jgi:N-acetylmuramoyl-L-alanine amidase
MEADAAARPRQAPHSLSFFGEMKRKYSRLAAVLAGLATLALTGCATDPQNIPGLSIDKSITAIGQDSRVRYLVLHYTASQAAEALAHLSRGPVSAHYLISDDPRVHIYRLVNENRRAWHAGVSEWDGRNDVNDSSIGIEIVNAGFTTAADGSVLWHPYKPTQIAKLRILLKALIARYSIEPANIVAHSDISPGRKEDPGPLFPWRELAKDGIGRWFDQAQVQTLTAQYAAQGTPDISWFQTRLAQIGYGIALTGVEDAKTRNVISAFQMHYRPARFDGEPDAETAAILSVLK